VLAQVVRARKIEDLSGIDTYLTLYFHVLVDFLTDIGKELGSVWVEAAKVTSFEEEEV
jgi:hypothetical protein